MGIDENEDANAGTSINISAIGIDKYEDLGDGFINAAMGELSENAGKQLKMMRSKVFMAITNCKKSYLPKKILAIKFS